MSYARDNLVCSSWRRTEPGWYGYSGVMKGNTDRPFCQLAMWHLGDHEVMVYPDNVTQFGNARLMYWPNKNVIPTWLLDTTIFGLEGLIAHEGPGYIADIAAQIIEVLRIRKEGPGTRDPIEVYGTPEHEEWLIEMERRNDYQ